MNQLGLHAIDQGSGVPLFFQHGLTANVTQVASLLGGLEGIRLISIDCPGHGLSPLHDGYMVSFDSYSDEVIRNMDALGIEKGVFGGVSMGGGIALNIALRYPSRVLGIIPVRPAWLDTGHPDNLSVLLDAASHTGQDNGLKDVELLPAFTEIKQTLPLAAKSILGIFDLHQQACISEVIGAMVADHPVTDLDQLRRIDVPSLIMGNEDDPLHPYDMAEAINERLKRSEIVKMTSGYIDKEIHRNQVRRNILDFIKNEIN